jgi:hypothetical protein
MLTIIVVSQSRLSTLLKILEQGIIHIDKRYNSLFREPRTDDKIIKSIRGKLISHQYRNTARSSIDIPIAQFIKEWHHSILSV